MSYADDMIDSYFEQMEEWERRDAYIDEELAVGEYLHNTPLNKMLGATSSILQSLPPHQREARLPTTAQSIFIQGIAGKKLTDKQLYALGLFVVRYGEYHS